MGQRVLFCGDRDWSDRGVIEMAFDLIGDVSVCIHGDARGADTIAKEIAEKLGIPVEPYPAKWKEQGRAAGPIRNQKMLDEGKPDLVVAFHRDLRKSKGTRDMVRRAKKAGVRVIVVPDQEWE